MDRKHVLPWPGSGLAQRETQGRLSGVKSKGGSLVKASASSADSYNLFLPLPFLLPACLPVLPALCALYFPLNCTGCLPPPPQRMHTRLLSQHTKHTPLLNVTLLSKAFNAFVVVVGIFFPLFYNMSWKKPHKNKIKKNPVFLLHSLLLKQKVTLVLDPLLCRCFSCSPSPYLSIFCLAFSHSVVKQRKERN